MATVELLEQDDAGELVGERHRPERDPQVGVGQVQALGPAEHEADVQHTLAAILEEGAEADAVVGAPVTVEQHDEAALGNPAGDLLVLANLDQLQPGMPGDQALVVLDVVGVGRPQATDGEDEDPHGCDTRRMNPEDGGERQINLHFSPEVMAGHYANFANVSHSDYEFTVTFARVDHEVEDEEVPGIVVARMNLSPVFMRELIDAMEDNYSKWRTREGIKNLPEFDEPGGGDQPA